MLEKVTALVAQVLSLVSHSTRTTSSIAEVECVATFGHTSLYLLRETSLNPSNREPV